MSKTPLGNLGLPETQTSSTSRVSRPAWCFATARTLIAAHSLRLGHCLRAAIATIRFSPGSLNSQQFIRYTHYQAIALFLRDHYGNGSGIRAMELGGSNGVIKAMLPLSTYEIAPNYPAADVQDLSAYSSATYDLVVLDQVLEHIRDPWRAVSEIHRILRPGGVSIATTPFLIHIHRHPDDFWRFTDSGLRQLFSAFGTVSVDGWGNRFTLKTIAYHGWLSCRNTRRLLAVATWNEPEWPLTFLTIATK
jgi:SAM-dependent methyltransferase